MKSRFFLAAVTAATVGMTGALASSPAIAISSDFGPVYTINTTGGTNSSDGLKIVVGSGQIQVYRDGLKQLYSDADPVSNNTDYLSNYFDINYIDSDGSPTEFTHTDWDTGTSSSALSADGKSGTVTNSLSSLSNGQTISLEIVYSYTYPNLYLTVATKLTLPANWVHADNSAQPTRLYWNADAYLNESDGSNQLEGTLAGGQQFRGVVTPDLSAIAGFSQVSGQNLFSWAGEQYCPFSISAADCPSTAGWYSTGTDAPNAIAAAKGIDNGFGVSVPAVTTTGASTASFNLIFVGCLAGVSALTCIDQAMAADAQPVLPNTGTDSTLVNGLATSGGFFLLVGFALMLMRVLRRIWLLR